MNTSSASLPLSRNSQIYQTMFLFVVLNCGILFYGIHFDYIKLLLTFGSVIFFDMLFGRISYGGWRIPFGGINAGFGISFFLRTDILWLYILAAFLAISSKYLFQVRGKHFFNPSNFGVFVTLCLFGWMAWTNPLQWGRLYSMTDVHMVVILGLLSILGPAVVYVVYRELKINLLYLIVPFVLTHVCIYVFFTVENSLLSFTKFYTPAFLIFTFHMLTDPMIIMENNKSKIFFGIMVAIGFYVLQYVINENYSLIASLFLATISIPVIRYLDAKNINQKITYGNVLSFLIVILLLSLFYYMIQSYGYPDLVFDNRCNALFCR